jgi:cytochrome c-type biogenesis protein CcmF
VFAPVSRESTLVLNNLFLSAATATVLLGTLYPLIVEAITGRPISVGPPYFNLTFAPLMAAALLILPAGPLLAWKRGDLPGAMQRLTLAAAIALGAGVLALLLVQPRSAVAAVGAAISLWLIAGSLAEMAERVKVGRAPARESLRRLGGLPRGAWGMTLGHVGLGVFVLGAAIETTGKVEAAATLRPGGTFDVGAYTLRLDEVRVADGPNYLAERASVRVTRDGDAVCRATPERRFFPAGGQTTSEVALCGSGLDDLYLVLGERRPGADGEPSWLVRAYWNPLAKLIFFGPAIMALGGLISLSDRRLRLAVPAKAKAKAKVSRAPVPVRPSLEDAPA